MRIAIIGSGVSGLVCAHLLQRAARRRRCTSRTPDPVATRTPTVWSSPTPRWMSTPDSSSTTSAPIPCSAGSSNGSVSGTQPSDMSFSVSDQRSGVEWRATSPSTVFAQRTQRRPACVLADAGRHRPFQPSRPRATREPTPGRRDSRRRARLAPVVVGVPRLVPGAPGLVDLVGGSCDLHSYPCGHLRPLLRAPRPSAPARPAELADGHRRISALCAGHPRTP